MKIKTTGAAGGGHPEKGKGSMVVERGGDGAQGDLLGGFFPRMLRGEGTQEKADQQAGKTEKEI